MKKIDNLLINRFYIHAIMATMTMNYQPPLFFDYYIPSSPRKVYGNSKEYYLDVKELFNLNNLELFKYEKNRPIDDEKVMEIVEHQRSHLLKYGSYDFHSGKINLGSVSGSNMKILDGQHRLKAMMYLEGMIECDIVLSDYANEGDRFEAYLTINKNTPVAEFYKTANDGQKYIISEAIKCIYGKYPKIFSNKRNHQRPHLNYEICCEKIYDYFNTASEVEKENMMNLLAIEESIDKMTKSIIRYNERLLKTKTEKNFPRYKSSIAIKNKFYANAKNMGCMLGMFKNYEWIAPSLKQRKKLVIPEESAYF